MSQHVIKKEPVIIEIPPERLAAALVKYFLKGVIERVEREQAEEDFRPTTGEAIGQK